MPNAFLDFHELIAPVSLDTFMSEHWEKCALHVPANCVDVPFGVQDIDAYLARGDLRVPALRMVHDGKNIQSNRYTSELTLGSHKSTDLIDTDKVLRLFQDGATILFQMAHTSFPPLMKWCAALELYWGFPVEMNVYLTPANSQGFTAHYDTHSVFALQVHGSKTWQLYEGDVALPFLDEPYSESNSCHSSPRLLKKTVDLQTGEFLYIPRGTFHSAKASIQPSLHITVGLFPPNRWSLTLRGLDALRSELPLRESSPQYLLPTRTNQSLKDEEEFLLSEIIKRLSLDLKALVSRKSSTLEIQPKEGRLLDFFRLDTLNLESILICRTGLCIEFFEDKQNIGLVLFTTKVSFPSHASQALKSILSQKNKFKPSSISGSYSDESKVVLCKRLVKEGLLTFA